MHNRTAQENMVSQQVRTWNVSDPAIADAMQSVPRHAFVPKRYQDFAYTDTIIPIKSGQIMLPPAVQGRLLQSLQLKKTDHVLEVGTGTGYLSAVMGKLAKDVVSVDILRQFSDDAALLCVQYGINNVRFQTGDAASGWDNGAPFDAILITGAMAELPEAFKNMLTVGGRLVAVLGEQGSMYAYRVTRISNAEFKTENLFDTEVPYLKNAPMPEEFHF